MALGLLALGSSSRLNWIIFINWINTIFGTGIDICYKISELIYQEEKSVTHP